MQSYVREGDGAEMVQVAPGCFVNRVAGEKIGSITRARAVRPKEPPKAAAPVVEAKGARVHKILASPEELRAVVESQAVRVPKNLKPQRIRRSRSKSAVVLYASADYMSNWLDEQENASKQIMLNRAALEPSTDPLREIGNYYDNLAAAE